MKTTDLIRTYLDSDIPVFCWGPPGVGKSATLTAMATDAKAHLEVLIGSTIDPVDVGGYLIPHAGQIKSDPPPWAKRLRAALDAGQQAWLFLDELPCAPPAVQAALLRVANERRVGDMDLTGCRIIAAGNPAETSTAEGDVGPAMANRWAHVDWSIDATDWVVGTLAGWGRRTSPEYGQAASAITGYLHKAPKSLNGEASGRAWPSPRSWTAAIRSLERVGLKTATSRAIVAGCVGDAAAAEWWQYMSARDLPDPEDLLSGKAALPKRGDQVSAALHSLASAAISDHKNRTQRIERAWEILATVRGDIAIGAGRALLAAAPDIVPDAALDLGNRIRALS